MTGPEDEVIINLYYEKEVHVTPPEITYYHVTIYINGEDSNPLAGYEMVFTGKKGAEVITKTVVSNEDGYVITDLDDSYTWTYLNFVVDEAEYYNEISFEKPPEEDPTPEIVVGEEHKITISYEFQNEPGGTLVNGHTGIENEFNYTVELTATSGDVINLMAESEVERDGDTYRLGTIFAQGGSSGHSVINNDLEEFVMIDSDVEITFVYTLVKPIYKITINYVDTEGNTIFQSTERSLEGSTSALGDVEYDVSDVLDFEIADWERTDVDGELTGNLDSDKVINIIFTQSTPEPDSEPEEPVVPEEPVEPEPEEPVVPEEPVTPVEPEPQPQPEPTPQPQPQPQPAPQPQPEPQPEPEPVVEEVVEEVKEDVEEVEEVVIEDDETPLDDFGGWALVNLISAILTVLVAFVLCIVYTNSRKQDENSEDDESSEGKDSENFKFFSLIPAVASVVIFIFTEDMRLPMVMVDKWTLLMILLLIANLLLAFLIKHRDEDREEDYQEGTV